MAMTAREAAWTALQRWRKNGAWSDAALNAVLQSAQLEPRDAALAARICYGTLQNLTLLDHYLSAYCTTPLQKLEPKVLDLLRLSAYQIVLLDKVPPRAAVNEAVALCRKGGCARASGLVNAVLRRVAEHRDALPEIPGVGTADYLAVRYSHPRWLAQLYIDAHGYAFAERALAANNADAPACLQVNTLKTTADALTASLRVDGVDVRDLSLSELRRRVGYIPQQGMLFSGTVESNLKFAGDFVSDDDMRRAAQTAQATGFIEGRDGGFSSEISQGGNNVSGGQRQRLSIARALAKRPEVIVFDDSFSALDYKTDARLREALAQNEKDAALVVVAQRIATIMRADQIIVLDEGRVVGQGTHEELLRSCPAYLEIAQSQLSAAELGLTEEEIAAVDDGADQKGGAR